MSRFDSYYQKVASIYDVLYGRALKPGHIKAVELMQLEEGHKILEVGIGTGLSLQYLPSYVQVVGIDVSDAMLLEAQKKVEEQNLKNVELKKMSALELDFPDNSFDRVFAPSVVSVVPQPERAVSEMLRVCKKDGIVCVVGHFASVDKLFFRAVDEFWDPITRKWGGFRMKTSPRVVENAPGSIVVKKQPVTDLINFNTIYILRKSST